MIQAIFSALGKKPSFTIVSFTSCERGPDRVFDPSLTSLRGILSKSMEVFVSSLSMIFLKYCYLLLVLKKISDHPAKCGIFYLMLG